MFSQEFKFFLELASFYCLIEFLFGFYKHYYMNKNEENDDEWTG